MPSVASQASSQAGSQVSASHQSRAHQPEARSRSDSSDRGLNSPFSDLLDSAAPAAEPPPAPRNARPDKSDAPRPADKNRKTEAPADRHRDDPSGCAWDLDTVGMTPPDGPAPLPSCFPCSGQDK